MINQRQEHSAFARRAGAAVYGFAIGAALLALCIGYKVFDAAQRELGTAWGVAVGGGAIILSLLIGLALAEAGARKMRRRLLHHRTRMLVQEFVSQCEPRPEADIAEECRKEIGRLIGVRHEFIYPDDTWAELYMNMIVAHHPPLDHYSIQYILEAVGMKVTFQQSADLSFDVSKTMRVSHACAILSAFARGKRDF